MRRLLQFIAAWLAARRASAHANLFVGPPLPVGAFRMPSGEVCRKVSRWNADHTMHTITFINFDGSPLGAEAGEDFEALPARTTFTPG